MDIEEKTQMKWVITTGDGFSAPQEQMRQHSEVENICSVQVMIVKLFVFIKAK